MFGLSTAVFKVLMWDDIYMGTVGKILHPLTKTGLPAFILFMEQHNGILGQIFLKMMDSFGNQTIAVVR